jgi:hypothetical protein
MAGKILYISLSVLVVIIGIGIASYLYLTSVPSSAGKIVVMHSGGQRMLVAACADPSYTESTSDYIVVGEIISSDSKWVPNVGSEGSNIYTYSDFRIDNYIKGEPLGQDTIQIVTMGGCIAGMCQSVEGVPMMSTGKKTLYITATNGELRIHGCGGIKDSAI